ncbi:hypothetical protein ACVWWG_008747 [Bradyrhizobium sp. LB7.2]
MNRITTAGMAVLLLCTGLDCAVAQSMGSAYTSTAPKDCRQIGKPGEFDGSTTRVCKGKDGLVVLIAEDDLREIVSVGRNRKAAAEEPAAKVWFGPFNSSETTVEWRAAAAKTVCDHSALAHRRWHRPRQAGAAEHQGHARRDPAAAGTGLPRRLCRRDR